MKGFSVDLHTHTLHSGDNAADPAAMVERAIELGLDGIAFTEHYSYEASSHADQLRETYGHRIEIFRGVEFSALEGHCLVFGVNTDLLDISGVGIRELIRAVELTGGVVIPSHPYRRGTGIGDLAFSLGGICAVEGYNGANIHSMNHMALKSASNNGLPVTGGSDAHSPAEVGSCVTVFEGRVTEDTLIRALIAGAYCAVDKRAVSRNIFSI